VWGWKKNTAPVNDALQRKLLKSGELTDKDRWWNLMDPVTGSLSLNHTHYCITTLSFPFAHSFTRSHFLTLTL
jgi:hypothetical protein